MNKWLMLGLLTSLVSCGEDVSSNRKQGQNKKPERTTPGAEAATSAISSHLHREKGSAPLTAAEEIAKILSNSLSGKLYRVIPLMDKDDEGSSENVTTITDIGRPTADCGSGSEFNGINARVADCASKNSEKAFWDGTRYGAAGEGNWKLVLKNNSKEFWLDEKTGLVWSHLLSPVNWCKASGNTENNTTDTTTDCNDIGEALSSCTGITFSEVGDQIKWRLPTRNDYLQADLNGLRFVLVKESPEGAWTATVRASSTGRSEAWVYHTTEGTLSGATMSALRQVRCVGAPVR